MQAQNSNLFLLDCCLTLAVATLPDLLLLPSLDRTVLHLCIQLLQQPWVWLIPVEAMPKRLQIWRPWRVMRPTKRIGTFITCRHFCLFYKAKLKLPSKLHMRGFSQQVGWSSTPSFRLTAFSPSFLSFLKRPLNMKLQTTQVEVGVGNRTKNVLVECQGKHQSHIFCCRVMKHEQRQQMWKRWNLSGWGNNWTDSSTSWRNLQM